MLLQRYWKTVVAVLGGNLIYFLVLAPYLPPAARHRRHQLDWGLVVDFWVCLAVFGLLSLVWKSKRK
ncbi:MAG: hypothetical protein HYX72_04385 [Acidobacteria bacterium]|nr:hypothetical protein [Acidobacteriota bacterium]